MVSPLIQSVKEELKKYKKQYGWKKEPVKQGIGPNGIRLASRPANRLMASGNIQAFIRLRPTSLTGQSRTGHPCGPP
jgi:hypothetical protein